MKTMKHDMEKKLKKKNRQRKISAIEINKKVSEKLHIDNFMN